MYMCTFRKNSETNLLNYISLNINKIKFVDMSKITKSNPVLKRNGVENSCNPSLSIHYFLSLTAMRLRRDGVFVFWWRL